MTKSDSCSISLSIQNTGKQNGVQFSGLQVQINGQNILNDITGYGARGKVMAVMGPSGSGKTTLLNAIAGRQVVRSGEITLDGKTVTKSVRRGISYVLQQDILFGNLTLRETIYFAAMLKLPDSMVKVDKMARIDEMVDALNIRDCLDTIIGSIFVRGLSGGEKKRANIACEIISNPDVLLLDEPTSGLDSYTAYLLMKQLKAYASSMNKVIITTIHQPATQIFNSFNDRLLLAKGKSVYFGAAKHVMGFFESIGRTCDRHYNPADFILEQINTSQENVQEIFDAIQNNTKQIPTDRSALGDRICGNGRTVPESGHDENHTKQDVGVHLEKAKHNNKWPTSFWTQFKLLTLRQFKVSRPKILSKFEIIKSLVIALVIACIFFQTDRTDVAVGDIMGLFYSNGGFWMVRALVEAASSFSAEMKVINKERSSGMYRLSAYILAKMTSELPLVIFLPLVCHPIIYWMAGQNPDPVRFFLSLVLVMMASIVGQSIGLLFSAIFQRVDVTIKFGTTYFLSAYILMGFLNRNIPVWLSWAMYTSVLYYVYRASLILEYSSSGPIRCVGGNASIFAECTYQVNNKTVFVPSNYVLELEGIKAPLYCYFLSLLIFIIACRVLIYFAFLVVRKPK